MKTINLRCPSCGAQLDISKDRKECFCSYCGEKILIDDEINRSEISIKKETIIRDETEIERIKADANQFKPLDILYMIIGLGFAGWLFYLASLM